MRVLFSRSWKRFLDWKDHFREWFYDNKVFALELTLVVVVSVLVFLLDPTPGIFRISDVGVSAIVALVAGWVGLLTLHTLQRAIKLSEDEDRRQKLSHRPILIVNIQRSADERVFLNDVALRITNGGAGPALDIRARWDEAIMNYAYRTEKSVGAFAMGAGETIYMRFRPDPKEPLGGRARSKYDYREKQEAENDLNNHVYRQEEYADVLDSINAKAARDTGQFAGRFILNYRGSYDDRWESKASFSAIQVYEGPLPLGILGERWPEIIIDELRIDPKD